MAMADVVHHAPDSAPHATEEIRVLTNGGFKSEPPQEQGILEKEIGDSALVSRPDGGNADTGCVSSLASCGEIKDGRNLYPGIVAENRQHMYYGPSYGYQPSSYIAQPLGHYMSNMGSVSPGYGPQYMHYYPHVPSSIMQHYPAELEGAKTSIKKQGTNKEGHPPTAKSVANGRQGYQAGYKNFLPLDGTNQWGLYPATADGNFYGSSNGYDLYSQQWHSSAQGFQPIPPPQNMGLQGNYIPVLPGRYQNNPRAHSAPNIYGKGFKVNALKSLSGGNNWRPKGTTKVVEKIKDPVSNMFSNDVVQDQSQVSCTTKCKVHMDTMQEHNGPAFQSDSMTKSHACPISKDDFNKENFQISYEKAKFYIIKSYSEDDVHKSIKYGVWSSTPNGNKSLDDAYKKAQEQSESFLAVCPVFFFFSVNSSGQFCGVAEMVGPVDFNKNMDFWLQGKWNGCFSVKWHIIKDVPNGHFRHIILSNNENKPVTHSRDTQEVHFHQGLEMLKIFKFFPMRTSLLDDFAFYDGRQKVLQERKLKQHQQQQRQQMVKQFKDKNAGRINNIAADVLSNDKENGSPLVNKPTVKNIELKMAELKVDMETISKRVEEGKDSIVHTKEEDLDDKIMKKEGTGLLPSKVAGKEGTSLELSKIAGKEEVARSVSNYKNALLGSIPFVLDQTIGV